MKTTQNEFSDLCLSIGGVVLRLRTDLPLKTLTGTSAFLCSGNPCQRVCHYDDVVADLNGMAEGANDRTVAVEILPVGTLPAVAGQVCGDDGIFCYYRDDVRFYTLAKPGTDGSVSLSAYTEDFSEVTLYINEANFPNVVRTADKILQLLPMKQLLAHFGAFLLHSSRISVAGKAVLFTAPSQTGKTTQARLWQEHAGAKIAGNDRTLLWTQEEQVMTGGYPVDGSSPVYSSEQIPLGAVVVLRQASENRVQRLPASQALRFLMEQTALDAWNAEECAAAQKFWLELIARSPVYLLQCRPDREAVACLREQLEKDEVIPGAIDTP